MPSKKRSMRGETVDFDLLKIKEQMKTAPKPVEVTAREDFVDRKLRRRVKRVIRKPTIENTEETTNTEE